MFTFVINISIHLKLLFIGILKGFKDRKIDFNTSHVTVYHGSNVLQDKYKCISIHLMLLFINMEVFSDEYLNHFNTSHVTVYRGW